MPEGKKGPEVQLPKGVSVVIDRKVSLPKDKLRTEGLSLGEERGLDDLVGTDVGLNKKPSLWKKLFGHKGS